MFRKSWIATLLAALLVLAAGCSGSGERGKNKNLDRPTAGDKR